MDFPGKGIYFLFNPVQWRTQPWEKNLSEILPYICAVQLRSPELNDRDLYLTALKLKDIVGTHSIPLIINNSLDTALAVEADGVHLGKKDIPIQTARTSFKGIIGASRHTPEGAREAQEQGADYIGCGPVFETRTKDTGREVIGVEGYMRVKKEASLPVIPIGGIGIENIAQLKSYSRIVAVSSAINLSLEPAKTTQELYNIIKS